MISMRVNQNVRDVNCVLLFISLLLFVLQDNLGVFLRGCEELGLKGSQLFDPGDLQDTSTRPSAK